MGDRSVINIIRIKGKEAKLENIHIAVGLRNFPDEKVLVDTVKGFAMVTGSWNEGGVSELGLGVVFNPEKFVKRIDIDGNEGSHYIVLKPRYNKKKNALVSTHRLAAYWFADGWIKNTDNFKALLEKCSRKQPTD